MSRRDVFPSHNGADKPTVEELARRLAEEQRERAEEQTRAAAQLRRRALWLTGVLILAVVAVVVAAGFGKQAADSATIVRTAEARPQAESTRVANAEATAEAWQLEAERQKVILESQALAVQAEGVVEQDPQLAILLGLEAVYQTHQNALGTMTTEACSAVHRAVVRSPWRATLRGHNSSVWHAAWSGDDGRIVTASADGSARIYFVRVDDLIEFACSRTGRNMTKAEWRRYMGPDVYYRKTCPNLPEG